MSAKKRNRPEPDLEKTDVVFAVGMVFVGIVVLYLIAQIIRWAVR